jgi:hypothetical protein
MRSTQSKDAASAALTGKAPPHNLGVLYTQQVSILFMEAASQARLAGFLNGREVALK